MVKLPIETVQRPSESTITLLLFFLDGARDELQKNTARTIPHMCDDSPLLKTNKINGRSDEDADLNRVSDKPPCARVVKSEPAVICLLLHR